MSGHWDEEDEGVTCYRCNESGLHWQEMFDAKGEPKQALFNKHNRPHKCVEVRDEDE